jgi:hypothetical protein
MSIDVDLLSVETQTRGCTRKSCKQQQVKQLLHW